MSVQSELSKALKYHERITEIQKALDSVKEQINIEVANIENEETNHPCDVPSGSFIMEVDAAMNDFQDAGVQMEKVNAADMIQELNSNQKRVFDKVVRAMNSEKDILRLYVSGERGTGKSYLIRTIQCWIKETFEKDTAITAPTGIAAFNVNGLTVHRMFQLPVEHSGTPKYTPLSDLVLKTIREQLKNVALIIIDEVSMVSDVMFMYIYKQLEEIFDTSEVEDGWFGKKHVLLFGNLLQLPPVNEEPVFVKLAKDKADKYLGALGTFDLWAQLFSYDELTINMRQKNDDSYRQMLSRVRFGITTDEDTEILETRKIHFNSLEYSDRLKELCEYIRNLPHDCVALFPTNSLCDMLNGAMLSHLPSEEIELIAQDTLDCGRMKNLMKKASKMLSMDGENVSKTAGIARVIIVKVGAKVMIRRNIDGIFVETLSKLQVPYFITAILYKVDIIQAYCEMESLGYE